MRWRLVQAIFVAGALAAQVALSDSVSPTTGLPVAGDTAAQGEPGDECVQGPDPLSGSIEYETISLTSVLADIEANLPVTLPFLQTSYQIQFTKWDDAVAPGARLSYVDGSGVHDTNLTSILYTGVLVQNASNTVVFGITENWIQGYVVESDRVHVLEMSRDPQAPTPYRSYDIDLAQYSGCEDSGLGSPPVPPEDAKAGEPGPPILQQIPPQVVLLYSDVNYFNMFWWCPWIGIPQVRCASNQMQGDWAVANWIFNRDAGVPLPISQILVHTPAHNGGLTSFNADTLLVQLRNDATMHVTQCVARICSPNFHAVHLYSGKILNGNRIGVAWLGGHFSLSQHVPKPWIAYFADPYHRAVAVVTHETGHNYNGDHPFALLSNLCMPGGIQGWTVMAEWHLQPRACAFSINNAVRIHTDAETHSLCIINGVPCTE